MPDFNSNFNKISEYLSSFVANKESKPDDQNHSPCSDKQSVQFSKKYLGLLGLKSPQIGDPNENGSDTTKLKTLPRSEEKFLERLSSYQYYLWTPIDLSPLVCASYGWMLKEKNMLQCVTCQQWVCATLPSPSDTEGYAAFLEKLKLRLKTGHSDWCGWQFHSSPTEFIHPPLHMTGLDLKHLKENTSKICSLGLDLPYLKIKEYLGKLDINEQLISSMYGSRDPLTKFQLTAAVLVLTGWEYDSPKKIKCKFCLRNVGLYAFLLMGKEEEYLTLRGCHEEKQERLHQKEIRRQHREKRRLKREKALQEKLESEREREEGEKKAREDHKRVQEAMQKISQMERDDSLSGHEEEEGEDLSEEEENSLLADDENEAGKDADERDSPQRRDEDEESMESEDGCTEERDRKEEASPEDDLWLDAVGAYDDASDSSPHSGSSSELDFEPSSPETIESTESSRKRCRSSLNSSAAEEEEGEGERQPKLAKIEVQQSVPEVSDEKEEEDRSQSSGSEEQVVEDEGEESSEGEEDSSDESEGEEPDQEEILYTQLSQSLFEPLEQHRHWCSWVLPCPTLYLDQTCVEDVPGYKIIPPQLKKILQTQSPSLNGSPSSGTYTRNIEGLRAFREMVASWSLPENEDSGVENGD